MIRSKVQILSNNHLALDSTVKSFRDMKKMTYDEYEEFCIQHPDEFWNEFDYFVDMENTADLKYDFVFDFPYDISAVDEDSDIIAAELPDDSYIFFETSVPEVLRYIRDNYSDDIDTTAIDQKLRELSDDDEEE